MLFFNTVWCSVYNITIIKLLNIIWTDYCFMSIYEWIMTTKTRTVLTSVVDQPGSINGDSNCIDSPCNERRVVVHTPTGPSSRAININSVEHLGVCNTSMRVTSPKGKMSTLHPNPLNFQRTILFASVITSPTPLWNRLGMHGLGFTDASDESERAGLFVFLFPNGKSGTLIHSLFFCWLVPCLRSS